MEKTGELHTFKMTKEALKIVEIYTKEDSKPKDYVFPLLKQEDCAEKRLTYTISAKTALVNKYLKKIGEMIGTDKRITSHIARHTFATLANKRVRDIEAVSKLLGHSDIATTKGYLASLDDERLDDALDNIFK